MKTFVIHWPADRDEVLALHRHVPKRAFPTGFSRGHRCLHAAGLHPGGGGSPGMRGPLPVGQRSSSFTPRPPRDDVAPQQSRWQPARPLTAAETQLGTSDALLLSVCLIVISLKNRGQAHTPSCFLSPPTSPWRQRGSCQHEHDESPQCCKWRVYIFRVVSCYKTPRWHFH